MGGKRGNDGKMKDWKRRKWKTHSECDMETKTGKGYWPRVMRSKVKS